MKLIAFVIFQTFFSIINTKAQCLNFIFRSILTGEDTFNLELNPMIQICENDSEIKIGTETFFIQKASLKKNGDYFFDIQESRGIGWPIIGFIVLSSEFDLLKVSVTGNNAVYSVFQK